METFKLSDPRWITEMKAHEYSFTQFQRFELPDKDKALVFLGHIMSLQLEVSWNASGKNPVTYQRMKERCPDWLWNAMVKVIGQYSPLEWNQERPYTGHRIIGMKREKYREEHD